jgi:hypothetical protein
MDARNALPPPREGLGTIVQAVPSQRWINVAASPLDPTAKQVVAFAHATALSSPLGGPGGLALGTTDHRGRVAAGVNAGAVDALTSTPATSATTTATRRAAGR